MEGISFMQILVLFLVGYISAILTLIGVIVGAFAVYRTKFGGESSLFSPMGTGDAGTVAGEYEGPDELSEEYEPPEGGDVDKIMQSMARRARQAREQMNGKGE